MIVEIVEIVIGACVAAVVASVILDGDDDEEEEIEVNDYRDDEAVLRRAELDIAVEAYDRLTRAELLVIRRKKELAQALSRLTTDTLAEYVRRTTDDEEE